MEIYKFPREFLYPRLVLAELIFFPISMSLVKGCEGRVFLFWGGGGGGGEGEGDWETPNFSKSLYSGLHSHYTYL